MAPEQASSSTDDTSLLPALKTAIATVSEERLRALITRLVTTDAKVQKQVKESLLAQVRDTNAPALKRKAVPRYAVCTNCKEEYDVAASERRKEEYKKLQDYESDEEEESVSGPDCRYHPGEPISLFLQAKQRKLSHATLRRGRRG